MLYMYMAIKLHTFIIHFAFNLIFMYKFISMVIK